MGLNPVAAPVNPLLVLDGPVGVLVGLPLPVVELVVVPLLGGGGGVPVLDGQYVVVKVSVSVVDSVVMVVVPVEVVVGLEEVEDAVEEEEEAV
jgi:hypothetical protein